MKKDFTQDFIRNETMAYLIIEEDISGRFVILASSEEVEEYGEQDAMRTLGLSLDDRHPVARQLARHLLSNGFALTSFRELVRETEVGFSFVDDTPGNERSIIAFHVRVDITDRSPFDQGEARMVSLGEYAYCLRNALFGHRIVNLGTARLLSEDQ